MLFYGAGLATIYSIGMISDQQISLIGYASAATAFVVLTVLLLTIWRDRMVGNVLPIVSLTGAGWAALLAYSATLTDVAVFQIFLIEIVHDFVWLFFLSSFLAGAVSSNSSWLLRYGGIVLCTVLLAIGALLELPDLKIMLFGAQEQLLVLGSIATSLYALVGIEQIYRNTRQSQQDGLRFLCLGIGGIFAFDLFLYSNAIITGGIGALLWDARGFVVAMCVPLIAIGVRRNPAWNRSFFVSRQVVFYTTTLVGAGIYLTVVGFAGYYIQRAGQAWGAALQLIFFCAALLAFLLLLLSDQTRARIRVFLTKHFFEKKYDYRQEWLRLIETITSAEHGLPLKKRAIKSLADILEAQNGHLWLKSESSAEVYRSVASWDVQPIHLDLPADDPLVKLLRDSGWVLNLDEVEKHPDRFQSITAAETHPSLASLGLLIPLIHDDDMIGFVGLSRPRTTISLNFEDHDLLKTAGKQIASYLAQEAATELLAESRQFEAYNRFTAYVMHDLKNAIAQQSLVVENAEKHKRNPKFIDDSIETIKGSVVRLRRVIDQLRLGSEDRPTARVDLIRLVLQAKAECSDRAPLPTVTVPDVSVVAMADRDRLLMAVCHAVRNAQDATPADGTVNIALELNGASCEIHISDTGCGMDEAFVKERLFRPFDSTKGAHGMGIGAHQIRETVRSIGGDITVHSEPRSGTRIVIRLPLVVDRRE